LDETKVLVSVRVAVEELTMPKMMSKVEPFLHCAKKHGHERPLEEEVDLARTCLFSDRENRVVRWYHLVLLDAGMGSQREMDVDAKVDEKRGDLNDDVDGNQDQQQEEQQRASAKVLEGHELYSLVPRV